MTESEATILSKSAVEMVTDGPCLTGTLENLAAGIGAKALPAEVLAKVRTDALALLGDVIQAYGTEVAAGEVGAGGSKRASSALPSRNRCPTGLLYGRVQSGKTVAMITFAAAAIDNGFRVIVVLTSDFVKLVEQTAERFGALAGPLIKDSLQTDSWDPDWAHVAKHIPECGVVFICTKNQQRLTALVEFLGRIGAADYPALVLDDEADQATLDTTTQARTSGRKGAPTQPSAIHRKTVQDSEEEQSIRQTLRHHVFIQVTATPYALLLQSVNSDLRPTFTRLLEAGNGYTGGEAFFDVEQVEKRIPPLIVVDEGESKQIEKGGDGVPPVGLQRAIAFFLVAAGAQNLKDPESRRIGQNFLCHTSQKTMEHEKASQLIINYLGRISDELRNPVADSETMMRLNWGYDELRRTLVAAPPFDAVIDQVRRRLPNRAVPLVNSANSHVDFGRVLNFIVGGNILGRGLTIENLLVTYYLRRAKISQMDTVLQHARMYGYRRALMPYTRVFLPEDLAARFHFIHVAEKNLRQQLGTHGGRSRVMVETMRALRATRLNVLDTGSLAAYESGHHLHPGQSVVDRKAGPALERALKKALGGSLKEGEFVEVPFSTIVDLLKQVPFGKDNANMWEPERLAELLTRLAERYRSRAFIYYREMKRSSQILPTGALSGDELPRGRTRGAPVLFVFRDFGNDMEGPRHGQEYWYPTLVLPEDMPNQVFNTTT